MTEQSSQIKLGDLLTRAGLLTADELKEGMMIARQQSLPVGRVLIMAQFISENSLQAAVQAQSMLKDGILPLDMALKALEITDDEGIPLETALEIAGWSSGETEQVTNKLGELLIESGFITQEQLQVALQQCQSSGLPLGRILVSLMILSDSLLAAALNAQILIRDDRITREQAIQGLKASKERAQSIEEALKQSGLELGPRQSIRLGELLQRANLIDEDQIMEAVEKGLVEGKHIGEVLIDSGLIPAPALDCALEVQKHVSSQNIDTESCGQVLSLMVSEGLSLEEAIKRTSKPKRAGGGEELPLYQLLQLAGLITPKDIERALKAGSRNTELMAMMLLLVEAVDPSMLAACMRLHRLVSAGALKTDQALMAIGICLNRKCELEQAFKSLGWSLPSVEASLTAESLEEIRRTTGQFAALDPEKLVRISSELRQLRSAATPSNAAAGAQSGKPGAMVNNHSDIEPSNETSTAEIPHLSNQQLTQSDEDEKDGDEGEDKRRKRLSDLIP